MPFFWVQHARLQWLNNGDRNTNIFHKSAKIRWHRNEISALSHNSVRMRTRKRRLNLSLKVKSFAPLELRLVVKAQAWMV
ncbi:hypothetical protein DsansV1_C24g0180731 [Dioscorea sansibarensis]